METLAAIGGALGSAGGAIGGAATTATGYLGSAGSALLSGAQGLAGPALTGLQSAAYGLPGFAEAAGSTILSGLETAWGAVAPSFEAIGSGAMHGLDAVGEFVGSLGELGTQGWESLAGALPSGASSPSAPSGGGPTGGALPPSTPEVGPASVVPPQAPGMTAENTPYLIQRQGDSTLVRDRFTGAEWTLPEGDAGEKALESYREANRQVLSGSQAARPGAPEQDRGEFWDNFTWTNVGRFALGAGEALGQLAPYLQDTRSYGNTPPPAPAPRLYDVGQQGLYGLFAAAAR